jgi:hypothetical protein
MLTMLQVLNPVAQNKNILQTPVLPSDSVDFSSGHSMAFKLMPWLIRGPIAA